MTKIDVSILVPVYNSETTLERCLDSIICQCNDIEIICVDDGSTDSSPLILKRYAIKDSRMKIITHDDNKGLLITRYDGVVAAKGRYTMFVDSDDRLCPNACEVLSKKMDDSGADMIHFGTKVIGPDQRLCMNFKGYLKPYLGILKGDEVFDKQFSIPISWNLWNRIYKSQLCKKAYGFIKLKKMTFAEDCYAMFFLTYCSRLYYGIEDEYYVYSCGDGISIKDYPIAQRIIRNCKTASLTRMCKDFLVEEGKYEQYGDICYRYPISFFELCIELVVKIDDEVEREKMSRLVYDSYGLSDDYLYYNLR